MNVWRKSGTARDGLLDYVVGVYVLVVPQQLLEQFQDEGTRQNAVDLLHLLEIGGLLDRVDHHHHRSYDEHSFDLLHSQQIF